MHDPNLTGQPFSSNLDLLLVYFLEFLSNSVTYLLLKMSSDKFKTPMNKTRPDGTFLRSTAVKRDSLSAELERDPQLSTAKRQQRAQVFTSTLSHANLERQLLASQMAKTELETKLREKEQLVERLERDRRWFADREKDEREEKERERVDHDEAKSKVDAENRSLRTSNTSLQQELADLHDTHSILSRNTSQTIASQKTQITALSHQNSLLQDECDQFKQLADERNVTIQELQALYDELITNQEQVSRRVAEDESMSVVREELHRQAAYLRNLESINTKLNSELRILRERHRSVEVLREENHGLKQKLTVLDELRTKVTGLEAELEAGRQEREKWANMSATGASSGTPISVTQALAGLRLSHARLLEEHGATVACLRLREARVVELGHRETELQEDITSAQQQFHLAEEQVARLETRAALAEREVGFLQALVSSYNAEQEVGIDGETRVDLANIQQMEEFQKLLEEHKGRNQQLEKDIDALGGKASLLAGGKSWQELSKAIENERAEKLSLQNDLDELTSESKQRLEKIEELEQAIFELRGEIAGGRHVPPGVRVLSMRDNPEQQWFDLRQAAMDRLKSENEALMRRLKDLEESGARPSKGGSEVGGELVPRESWELVSKDKQDLEELVKQKEKRLLRLQQVFTSKSAEFREVIASILGVKLAFYPNGSVRVTSVYDLCASFVFQPASSSEGAKMQLVAQGEGGPQDLPSLMQYWIEGAQCIPGFLASITLECYEKSKRGDGDMPS